MLTCGSPLKSTVWHSRICVVLKGLTHYQHHTLIQIFNENSQYKYFHFC